MRLFRIDGDKKFVEYEVQDFKNEHLEGDLESLLEVNPDSILNDEALLVIGRQITTNFKTFLDILSLDRSGNTAIIELKRDRTPRETIAQALEYASYVESLNYSDLEDLFQKYSGNEDESLSEYHKIFFNIEASESITFNKNQRIIIVGSNISPEVRQQAIFLNRKGIPVVCVEFNYFQTQSGEQLLSTDVVIGKETLKPESVSTDTLPKVDRDKFLKSLDEYGRPVFERLLNIADEHGLPIHWGGKGFSLNVEVDGKHVALCYGYPPHAVYRQSIYTAFAHIKKNIQDGEAVADEYSDRISKLNNFVQAGNEKKWIIESEVSPQFIEDLINVILDLAQTLKRYGSAIT